MSVYGHEKIIMQLQEELMLQKEESIQTKLIIENIVKVNKDLEKKPSLL